MFVDRMILITIPSLLMNVLLLLYQSCQNTNLMKEFIFFIGKMCLIVMKQVQK